MQRTSYIIVVVVCALFAVTFLGCKPTPKQEDLKENFINRNRQRLDTVISMLSKNQTYDYDSINKEVVFVSGLIKAVGGESSKGNMYQVNLDSLLLKLESLPVVATELIIYRDWLTEAEIRRTESIKTIIYNEIPSPLSLTQYIEQTNNKTEKRAKSIHDASPDWEKEDCINIAEGKIWVGMSKEMVLKSRGRPSDINRTVGSWGIHEQWVYGILGPYLYLEDGVLTSWQD